jgi:putative acetyltransferase
VDATHDFLTVADRTEIDVAACAYLAEASLWVLTDETDRPMAFSAVNGSNMDALSSHLSFDKFERCGKRCMP